MIYICDLVMLFKQDTPEFQSWQMLSTTERKFLLKEINSENENNEDIDDNKEKVHIMLWKINIKFPKKNVLIMCTPGYHLCKVKDITAKDKISTEANGIRQLTKIVIEKFPR